MFTLWLGRAAAQWNWLAVNANNLAIFVYTSGNRITSSWGNVYILNATGFASAANDCASFRNV
jgi:hypothetical protein